MEPPVWPPARPSPVGETAVERPVDPAMWLGRLRAAHPDWGFVYDPFASRWVALRHYPHMTQ